MDMNGSVENNTLPHGGEDDSNLDNLMPALVQIFLTIVVGYVTGYFDIIGRENHRKVETV